MATDTKLGTSELLFRCAYQMGLRPTWITPGGLFAVSVAGQEKYVNCGQSSISSHLSSSLAKNKYSTRLILQRHNLPNIPFARVRSQEDAQMFLAQHDKIIAKPIQGSGSKDIHIITSAAQLTPLIISKYILEKYIAGTEMRYLVLNDAVIAVHRSEYGTSVDKDRALQRFSYPHNEWDQTLVDSSLQIAKILGLKFTAIDYMIDEVGRAYVLEANSTPGLKWFHAPTSGPIVDVARLFLEALVEDTYSKRPSSTSRVIAAPTTPIFN
ncbi:hypothetical protein BH09PAT4_BH09PAT4_04910 [soil metagenome]